MVRADIETVDAALLPDPVYGQVPALAAGDRGIIDLLAAGRDGRLAVLELKASADIHLPLQALDYWVRVKWHLDRGEFTPHGYFPGMALDPAPPRLLLVSPSLEFHPVHRIDSGVFLTGDRCGANRAGGRMAEGSAGDVPARGRAAPLNRPTYDQFD